MAGKNVSSKTLVQLARLCVKQPEVNLDPSRAQFVKAFTSDDRIRIRHRCHHAANSGGDHKVRARSRASMMRAWRYIDVEDSTTRARLRLLERQDLSVLDSVIAIGAGARDCAAGIDDDGADPSAGRSQ